MILITHSHIHATIENQIYAQVMNMNNVNVINMKNLFSKLNLAMALEKHEFSAEIITYVKYKLLLKIEINLWFLDVVFV